MRRLESSAIFHEELIALLHREERKAQMHKSLYLEEIIRPGTRMTWIKRIYTDPCVSASTVAPVDVAHTYGSCHTWRSVFYRTPPIIDDDKKPQMNADERRLIALFHREERNAQMHKSLYLEEIIRPGTRMTRIRRIYTDGFQHDDRRFVILAPFMEDNFK